MADMSKGIAFRDKLLALIPSPSVDRYEDKHAYVGLLVKHGLLYHFDDCAHDCLGDYELGDDVLDLINEYSRKLHSEELFDIAVRSLHG